MSKDVERSAFNSTTKIHSSLLIYFFISFHWTFVLGLFSSTSLETDPVQVPWIQRNSGTWACRNPSQVNHSSLNRTRRELQQYLLCFWHLKQNASTKNISHLKHGSGQVSTGATSYFDTVYWDDEQPEISSTECQYQATVAARIGIANSQNHCIRIFTL